jgi:hypothetical protein
MLNLIKQFNIAILLENILADEIANSYIENNVIQLRYKYDALHIVMATVYGMDKIIRLNFKHIVRDKTRIFSQYINLVYGFRSIDIKSPMEIIMGNIDNE